MDPVNTERWQYEPEDESSPCGCGDESCRIDGNDATNVFVNGVWFSCCCVGLCFYCSSVDSMHRLIQVKGGWLAHEKCASDEANRGRQ
jgi:hypothetical protein